MLNFQITNKKNTVVEKYDFPVLTINPKTNEAKSVQKFELNNAAVNELKLEAGQHVGLAFTMDKELVLVNLDNNEAQFSSKVNKDFTFNSKKMFEKLVKHYDLDENELNEMVLFCSLDEEDDYYYATMRLNTLTLDGMTESENTLPDLPEEVYIDSNEVSTDELDNLFE